MLIRVRIFLVRHGQTDWNTQHRVQGHTNIPLNKLGIHQSKKLVATLKYESIGHVYCSDLIRCAFTARNLSKEIGAELVETPILRERNFGHLEGETFHVTTPFFNTMESQGLDYVDIKPDQGESIRDVWNRVDPIVTEIEKLDNNVVIITHGGTCSILLAKFLKMDVKCVPSFTFSNCSITEIKKMRGKYYKLVKYACNGHLVSNS